MFQNVDLDDLRNLATVGALFVSMGALIVTIVAQILESRRSRAARNVDLIIEFDERFENEEMKKKRKVAGDFLSQHRSSSKEDKLWRQVDDVIDFFEVLGTCVRMGHIDIELAYRFFFYWVDHYWLACSGYINAIQRKIPTQWENAEWLYTKLRAYDVKRNAGKVSNPTEDDLSMFFDDERQKA